MPEITLPASIKSVSGAMKFIHENLEQLQLDGLTSKVELAVEELIINVINYAYPNADSEESNSKNKIVMGCRSVNLDGQQQFCVWLRDWGRPFDPFKIVTPNTNLTIEERDIGGLGIHLVKNISSHYSYSGSDGSNTVEIYFLLDSEDADCTS